MRKKIAPKLVEKITTWREAGRSFRSIAEEVDFSISAVSYWCLKRAVDPPHVRVPGQKHRAGPILRGGHVLYPFSPEDDALIIALDLQGFGPSKIARHLTRRDPGRPRRPHTITTRLMILARHEMRAEQQVDLLSGSAH